MVRRRLTVRAVGAVLAACMVLLGSACSRKPPQHAEKPVTLDLWVMSQCPFGTHVESLVGKIVGVMGALVETKIHFIVEDQNGKLVSLHGDDEVARDRVQACVGSLYPRDQLPFILAWNATPESGAASVAAFFKLDAEKIQQCVEGGDADRLLREMIPAKEALKVTGSPTIFLDGKLFDGHRSSLGIVEKICESRQDDPEFRGVCLHKPNVLTYTDADANGPGNCASGGARKGEGGAAKAGAWKAFFDAVDPAAYSVTAVVPKDDPWSAWPEIKKVLAKSLPGARIEEVPYPGEAAEKVLAQYKLSWLPALLFERKFADSPVYRAGKPFFVEIGDRIVGNPVLWGANRDVARTATPGTLDVYYKPYDEKVAGAIPQIARIVADDAAGKKTKVRFHPVVALDANGKPGTTTDPKEAEIYECGRQITIADQFPGKFPAYLAARLKDVQKGTWEEAAKAAGLDEEEVHGEAQDRKYLDELIANSRAFVELQVVGNFAFVVDNQVLVPVNGKQDLEDLLKKLP